jgi:8-oxo-dGTP pyrophosphatase MutT (NUDIX family)
MWVPPGGHCDTGESIEECARREFLEETGYHLRDLRLLMRFVDDNVPDVPPSIVTVFWARYDGRQTPVCREGQALEFVSRSRAAELHMPAYLVRVWDSALDAASIAA